MWIYVCSEWHGGNEDGQDASIRTPNTYFYVCQNEYVEPNRAHGRIVCESLLII